MAGVNQTDADASPEDVAADRDRQGQPDQPDQARQPDQPVKRCPEPTCGHASPTSAVACAACGRLLFDVPVTYGEEKPPLAEVRSAGLTAPAASVKGSLSGKDSLPGGLPAVRQAGSQAGRQAGTQTAIQTGLLGGTQPALEPAMPAARSAGEDFVYEVYQGNPFDLFPPRRA